MYTGILQKLEELEKRIAELEEMHSEDDDAEEDFEGTGFSLPNNPASWHQTMPSSAFLPISYHLVSQLDSNKVIDRQQLSKQNKLVIN